MVQCVVGVVLVVNAMAVVIVGKIGAVVLFVVDVVFRVDVLAVVVGVIGAVVICRECNCPGGCANEFRSGRCRGAV